MMENFLFARFLSIFFLSYIFQIFFLYLKYSTIFLCDAVEVLCRELMYFWSLSYVHICFKKNVMHEGK